MRNIVLTMPLSDGSIQEIEAFEVTPNLCIHRGLYSHGRRGRWRITHTATGCNTGWYLPSKAAAARVAEQIEPLLNWKRIAIEWKDRTQRTVAFVGYKPTKKQKLAITAAHEANGAMRSP